MEFRAVGEGILSKGVEIVGTRERETLVDK